MKRILLLSFLLCFVSNALCQETKDIPDTLWNLELGKTNYETARRTLLGQGLRLSNESSMGFTGEGEFTKYGFNYFNVDCRFADNKLAIIMLFGSCEDRNDIANAFTRKFYPLKLMTDEEREVILKGMGMSDFDLLFKEDKSNGRTILLFIEKGTGRFVIAYHWDMGTDILLNQGKDLYPSEDKVTKFLGIPVDGSYKDMRERLIAKGFKPNLFGNNETFSGEFNGSQVSIIIGTYKNNVSRIIVMDYMSYDETQIIVRYNNLVRQFMNNQKYFPMSGDIIDEGDNISYEMRFNHKTYQCSFIQKTSDYETVYQNAIQQTALEAKNHFSEYDIKYNYENKVKPYMMDKVSDIIIKRYGDNLVWFTIVESLGKYRIALYYENRNNMPNGEDL